MISRYTFFAALGGRWASHIAYTKVSGGGKVTKVTWPRMWYAEKGACQISLEIYLRNSIESHLQCGNIYLSKLHDMSTRIQ